MALAQMFNATRTVDWKSQVSSALTNAQNLITDRVTRVATMAEMSVNQVRCAFDNSRDGRGPVGLVRSLVKPLLIHPVTLQIASGWIFGENVPPLALKNVLPDGFQVRGTAPLVIKARPLDQNLKAILSANKDLKALCSHNHLQFLDNGGAVAADT